MKKKEKRKKKDEGRTSGIICDCVIMEYTRLVIVS